MCYLFWTLLLMHDVIALDDYGVCANAQVYTNACLANQARQGDRFSMGQFRSHSRSYLCRSRWGRRPAYSWDWWSMGSRASPLLSLWNEATTWLIKKYNSIFCLQNLHVQAHNKIKSRVFTLISSCQHFVEQVHIAIHVFFLIIISLNDKTVFIHFNYLSFHGPSDRCTYHRASGRSCW